MKKRILSMLLVLLMVVSLVPTVALAARGDNDIAYPVTNGNIYFDESTGTVTECDNMVTEAVIPSELNGTKVKKIGTEAFSKCSSLKSITIPDSVVKIGNGAFYGCTGLMSINIPSCVTSIGNYVFQGCKNLIEINVEEDNSAYSSDDGVLLNKAQTMLKTCPEGKSNKYIIPNTVTEIREDAFENCSSLTNVTIPNSVKSIGKSAFGNCSSLTSITIPNSVKIISDNIFRGCSSLMNVAIPDSVTSIGIGAFFDCSSLTSVTIPNSVTSIGSSAFQDCSSLTSVTVPNSVMSICAGAFHGCTSLASVEIPDSITSIDDWVFSHCEGLTNVTIPNSVTSIGEWAFFECTSLTNVTIPNSVTSIGERAFFECTSLTDVYYSGSKAQWTEVMIDGWNYMLLDANIHYSSAGPVDPVDPVDPVSFVDVPSDAFYANAVKWAVENEITTGVGNNRFDPNGQCTRGQVVTFLWRAAGKPTVSANVSFSDVQPGAFYYEAVKWAVANGITTGVGGNRFAPNDSCTRGQVVTFLHRAENSPSASTVSSFTDVPVTAFYYNAVNWAVANGITKGTGNGRFSPNDTCTRAQVVTFLYRAQ